MNGYTPAIVANGLLKLAREKGVSVDHMKLQKLVFFANAWHLALHDRPAVQEEPEAWKYGPVFTSLYHRLKEHGSRDFSSDLYLDEWSPEHGAMLKLVPGPADTELWDTMSQVIDRYGKFNALQLSSMSHEAGGPWEQTQAARQRWISHETVKQYYRGKLQSTQHAV
jgi:uncharacterized phage-associated protein